MSVRLVDGTHKIVSKFTFTSFDVTEDVVRHDHDLLLMVKYSLLPHLGSAHVTISETMTQIVQFIIAIK